MKLRIKGLPNATERRQKDISNLVAQFRSDLEAVGLCKLIAMEIEVEDLVKPVEASQPQAASNRVE